MKKIKKIEFMGYTADVFFVLAYLLVSQKILAPEGAIFNLMNLTGAIIFGAYAVIKKARPIWILEIFWGGIAVLALWRLWF